MSRIKVFLTLLFFLVTEIYPAVRYSNHYSIVDDIIDNGGSDFSCSVNYKNQTSICLFSDVSYTSVSSTEITCGFLPNINNIPFAVITNPLNQIVTDYLRPLFIWTYTDYDGNPQYSFNIELSTSSDFSVINYTSLEQCISSNIWQFAEDIKESKYYVRVKVKDEYWHEQSLIFPDYFVIIDTSPPYMPRVTKLESYISSAAITCSAVDVSSLKFRVKYSTSANFDVAVTTYTEWYDQHLDIYITKLKPSTTYYIQVQAKDCLEHLSVWSDVVEIVTTKLPAPDVLGKFSDVEGYYVEVWFDNIFGANVLHSLQCVYSDDYNIYVGYLKGDKVSISQTPVWFTEQEWEAGGRNIFRINEPNFKIAFVVNSLTEETTYQSLIGWGKTPPPQVNKPLVEEIDNDRIKISWQAVDGAVKYRIYASTNIISGVFSLLDEKNVTVAEHNVDGGQPSSPLANIVDITTYSISINWQKVVDPSPSLTYYYKISAVNEYNAESKHSSISDGIRVQPKISGYKIFYSSEDVKNIVLVSTQTTECTISNLLPNTKYKIQISAVSTDKLESNIFNLGEVYTLAEIPDVELDNSWSIEKNNFIELRLNTKNNPVGTKYAIRTFCLQDLPGGWLDGNGSVSENQTWLSNDIWSHTNLLPQTTYIYQIFSLNFDNKVNGFIEIATVTVRNVRPEITKIVVTDQYNNEVQENSITESAILNFYWESISTYPIVGYSLIISTTENENPDDTIDTYEQMMSSVNLPSLGQTTKYFFKIKLLDTENVWSEIKTFVFYFNDDFTPLKINNVKFNSQHVYNNIYRGIKTTTTISIEFSKPVSTPSVVNNISLLMLQNKNGEKVNNSIEITNFTISSFTLVNLNLCLEENSYYELIISSNIKDVVGNKMLQSYRYQFNTVIEPENKVKLIVKEPNIDKFYIELQPNSVNQQVYFVANIHPEKVGSIKISPSSINVANSKLAKDLVILYTIEIAMFCCDTVDRKLTLPAKLVVFYDDVNYQYINDTEIKINSLSLYKLDETKNAWVKIPSYIDKLNKCIYAEVRNFSVYALVGSIDMSVKYVRCYPVPWQPNDGKYETGTLEDGITFINLPLDGEIKIFTVDGKLVRKFVYRNNLDGVISWNGKNENGKDVASGVYLWVVTSSQDKKTGKLIIIR